MRYSTTSFTVRLTLVLASVGVVGRASSLSDLAARADAVVVGTINTRFESRNLVSFNVSILRVLKGTALPGSVAIAHSWAGGAQGPPATYDAGITGIWFLSHSTAGAWDVIPCRPTSLFGSLYFPASTAPPQGVYSYTPRAPLADALNLEAAAGIQATQASPADLMAVLSYGAASAPSILSALVASPNPSHEAAGVAGMLLTNQPGALSALLNVWPQLANEPNRVLVISALRDEWRDTTPAGVAQLSSLVGSSAATADLRAAAIRSLMATHTAASLPLFSQLGDSGARRTGFRGERENDSGVKANRIPR